MTERKSMTEILPSISTLFLKGAASHDILEKTWVYGYYFLLLMQQVKVAQPVNGHPVLLIAAADSPEGLPPTIRRCFSHEISMDPLSEEQRKEMLSQSLQHVSELLPNVGKYDVSFLVCDILIFTTMYNTLVLMSYSTL